MNKNVSEEYERGYDNGYYDGSADGYNKAFKDGCEYTTSKETPKKPIKRYEIWICSECHREVKKLYLHCPHCGQELDWSK